MRSRPADAVLNHLIRRRRLSTAEEQWLDRDGDGRLTSRDLLLARLGAKPAMMPELVPRTRHLKPGESLKCLVLGRCPGALRATCRINGRSLPLEVAVRREGKRSWVEVELPADMPLDDRPESLVVWVMAPNTIPRALSITIGASLTDKDSA